MGVRLSPNGDSQGVNDSNPEKLFVSAAEALSAIKIAFLELREPGFDGTFGKADHSPIAPAIRQVFRALLILNSDYGHAKAAAVIASGEADAITFGRPFIANPDLPRRVRLGLPLAKESSATSYSQGAEGYPDYSCAES
jgi:N-ethylmaleimide reductase